MQRLLLVEDSTDFQLMVKKAFADRSYELAVVASAAAAYAHLEKYPVDLILLDVGLPDQNGFEFCSELKDDERYEGIPIIFLTAKDKVTDKVLGFSLGAEDYVVKPFEPLELKARVDAKFAKLAKHANQAKSDPAPRGVASQVLRAGDLVVDLEAHQVQVLENRTLREIDLTPTEFRLLSLLCRHAEKPMTREKILAFVWGDAGEVFDRSIDKHICSLRQKLGHVGGYIVTVPTVGYSLQPKSQAKK